MLEKGLFPSIYGVAAPSGPWPRSQVASPSTRLAFLAPNGYLPPPKRSDQLPNPLTFFFNPLGTKHICFYKDSVRTA
jgi:hypothetical protein